MNNKTDQLLNFLLVVGGELSVKRSPNKSWGWIASARWPFDGPLKDLHDFREEAVGLSPLIAMERLVDALSKCDAWVKVKP